MVTDKLKLFKNYNYTHGHLNYIKQHVVVITTLLLQWNPATQGTNKSGWISKLAGLASWLDQ